MTFMVRPVADVVVYFLYDILNYCWYRLYSVSYKLMVIVCSVYFFLSISLILTFQSHYIHERNIKKKI